MFYSRNFGGKASKVQVYLNMYTDVKQFFYLVLKVSCHRVTTIWSKKKKKKKKNPKNFKTRQENAIN